jgi:hypothetical protein
MIFPPIITDAMGALTGYNPVCSLAFMYFLPECSFVNKNHKKQAGELWKVTNVYKIVA